MKSITYMVTYGVGYPDECSSHKTLAAARKSECIKSPSGEPGMKHRIEKITEIREVVK